MPSLAFFDSMMASTTPISMSSNASSYWVQHSKCDVTLTLNVSWLIQNLRLWMSLLCFESMQYIYNTSLRKVVSNGRSSRNLGNEFWWLTKKVIHVINCIRSRVKKKSKHTNLMKISRNEGYNGKYGSNPQRIKEIYGDLFEFDQIEQWIHNRNWERWYFMKENFKKFSRNQKSSNLTLISWRNWRSKWDEIFENGNHEITEN